MVPSFSSARQLARRCFTRKEIASSTFAPVEEGKRQLQLVLRIDSVPGLLLGIVKGVCALDERMSWTRFVGRTLLFSSEFEFGIERIGEEETKYLDTKNAGLRQNEREAREGPENAQVVERRRRGKKK